MFEEFCEFGIFSSKQTNKQTICLLAYLISHLKVMLSLCFLNTNLVIQLSLGLYYSFSNYTYEDTSLPGELLE